MKLFGDHRQQIGEIDAARILEPDHHHRFVRRRDPARDERIRGIDGRHALEVDVGLGKLRADVVHIIRHPPQDGVGHRLRGIAAIAAVAMQLLDPLEIDHRNNADLEIGMLGNVDLVGHDRAMQAFIEQQIGAFRQRPPFGKGAGSAPYSVASSSSWT